MSFKFYFQHFSQSLLNFKQIRTVYIRFHLKFLPASAKCKQKCKLRMVLKTCPKKRVKHAVIAWQNIIANSCLKIFFALIKFFIPFRKLTALHQVSPKSYLYSTHPPNQSFWQEVRLRTLQEGSSKELHS